MGNKTMTQKYGHIERVKNLSLKAHYLIHNHKHLKLEAPIIKGFVFSNWQKKTYICPQCSSTLKVEDVSDNTWRLFYFCCNSCGYENACLGTPFGRGEPAEYFAYAPCGALGGKG